MIWLEEEVERLKSEIMILRSAGGDTQVGPVMYYIVLDNVYVFGA